MIIRQFKIGLALSCFVSAPQLAFAATDDPFYDFVGMFGDSAVGAAMKSCAPLSGSIKVVDHYASTSSMVSTLTFDDLFVSRLGGDFAVTNWFLCHLMSDLKVNSAGSYTGTLNLNFTPANLTAMGGILSNYIGLRIKLHSEVAGSAGGGAQNGYDYAVKTWVCTASSSISCTQASQFSRLFYMTFTKFGGANKGALYIDAGALNGTLTQQGKSYIWDMGSSAIASGKAFFKHKMGNSATDTSGYDVSATSNGNIITMASSSADVSGGAVTSARRTSLVIDTKKNIGLSYSEVTPGVADSLGGDPNLSATGDIPSKSQCVTRTPQNTDFVYSAAAPSVCSGLTLPAMSSNSLNTVGRYTFESVAGTIVTSMTANPSSI